MAGERTSAGRRFTLGACLGEGGFGEVYLADMTSPGGLERRVAVKLLRKDAAPDTQALQRLRDEARMLAQLDHPSILRVEDLVVLEGRTALVTEYVDGVDLTRAIRGEGLPPRALYRVVGAIASALDAAWKQLQLVHRDIKPSNIRISRHGGVKLLDFGIARSRMAREAQTSTELVVGSVMYMAPERFEKAEPGPASDVYALGCVLYEALAGKPLFAGLPAPARFALAFSQERHDAVLAEQLLKVGDPGDRVLLAEMLRFEPDSRPTHRDVASRCDARTRVARGASLESWCAGRDWQEPQLDGEPRVVTEGTLATPRPAPQPEPAPDPPKPRRWPVVVGALLLAAVPLALVAWPDATPEPQTVPEAPAPVDAPAATVEPEAEPEPEPVVEPKEPTPAPAVVRSVVEPASKPPVAPEPTKAPAPIEDVVEPADEPDELEAPAPVATLPVTIASIPMGATVWLDGERIGTTQMIEHPIPEGDHVLKLDLGDGLEDSKRIHVTPGGVVRYVWHSREDRWESHY